MQHAQQTHLPFAAAMLRMLLLVVALQSRHFDRGPAHARAHGCGRHETRRALVRDLPSLCPRRFAEWALDVVEAEEEY